jgi:hypothetical protein
VHVVVEEENTLPTGHASQSEAEVALETQVAPRVEIRSSKQARRRKSAQRANLLLSGDIRGDGVCAKFCCLRHRGYSVAIPAAQHEDRAAVVGG